MDQEKIGTLHYFGDPMCSWCWGLKPVLEQLDAEYPELQRVTVMGGLRGGEELPMNEGLVAMIQDAWRRIEESTGQHFEHGFWDRHRPLATTWPACKAVVTARLVAPEMEWPYMVALFKAYFLRELDPSLRETHIRLAGELGMDVRQFQQMLNSSEVGNALEKDFQKTRAFGISAFPTLVLTLNDENYLISPGYQPIDEMRRAINSAYEEAGVDFVRPESGLYS